MEYDTASDDQVSANAKKTAESVGDLARAVAAKAKEAARDTAEKARSYSDVSAAADSREIGHLGSRIDKTLLLFEEAIMEIGKEGYEEQAALFDSYQKFLREQMQVVQARMDLARTLKPGA
ncbi:MAG: hypothetical protein ABI361_11080 [Nitrososphaera sp.]|jgi:hypothetical protein